MKGAAAIETASRAASAGFICPSPVASSKMPEGVLPAELSSLVTSVGAVEPRSFLRFLAEAGLHGQKSTDKDADY